MRAAIKDAELLRTLRPMELATYLGAAGWRQAQLRTGISATWLHGEGSNEVEIQLPLDRTPRDYAIRVSEALSSLEVVEGRSQLEIFHDLQLSSTDVIRLRVIDEDAADGSVPLDDGVALVERAREMVVAAACAAVQPRARIPNRRPDRAKDYVKNLRLGQTEVGSYIVTVLSRVRPSLVEGAPAGDTLGEPFERRAVTTLALAVAAAKAAAEESGVQHDFAPFQRAVAEGVSANLCDAIVGIVGGVDQNRKLELSFSWSRGRPMLEANVPSRVTMPSDVIPVLDEASRIWKQRTPLEDYEFTGIVVKLHRHGDAEVGRVTLFGQVEDRQHSVSVELGERDYSIATRAHDERTPIVVYGDIERSSGGGFTLRNPRGFQMLLEDGRRLQNSD